MARIITAVGAHNSNVKACFLNIGGRGGGQNFPRVPLGEGGGGIFFPPFEFAKPPPLPQS